MNRYRRADGWGPHMRMLLMLERACMVRACNVMCHLEEAKSVVRNTIRVYDRSLLKFDFSHIIHNVRQTYGARAWGWILIFQFYRKKSVTNTHTNTRPYFSLAGWYSQVVGESRIKTWCY